MCIKKVEKVLTPVGSAFTKERMSCLKSIKKGLTCKKKILILCACLFLCLFFFFIFKNIGRTNDGIRNTSLAWRTYLILDMPHTIALSRQNLGVFFLCA